MEEVNKKDSTKNIIFIKKGQSTFINKDEELLREDFNLHTITIKQFHGVKLLLEEIRIFGWLLFRKNRFDAVYIWFADFHGFLPVFLCKLFHKKSLVVLGGYDVYSLPEFHYGINSNPIRNFCARYIYKNASHIITLGKQMQKDVLKLIGSDDHYSQVVNIPTGYSAENWYCDSPKMKRIVMVAFSESQSRNKIKGIDRFIEVAQVMPQYEFILIGLQNADKFFPSLPQNLKSIGVVENPRKWYSESMVYLLLSRTEGFPNVLCESMLCECVPVANDVGGAKEIVGNTGYLIKTFSIENTQKLIEKAMNSAVQSKGSAARLRIKKHFTIDRRRNSILQILKDNPS